MFWRRKNKPNLGDFRIAEKYIPSSNSKVYEVQKYVDGYDIVGYYKEWVTEKVCADMEAAVDWVNRLRIAADVNYYYCQ